MTTTSNINCFQDPQTSTEIDIYTSSAVLATASNPIYEKNTVAEPASIPLIPKGKNLSTMIFKKQKNYCPVTNLIGFKEAPKKKSKCRDHSQYPPESSYPIHPVLKPRYPPAVMTKSMAHTFPAVTMLSAKALCKTGVVQSMVIHKVNSGQENLSLGC